MTMILSMITMTMTMLTTIYNNDMIVHTQKVFFFEDSIEDEFLGISKWIDHM